jgi:preprotein translocase subunit SecG
VYTFLTVLHVFVCIFLMLVVLLQAGRGGGIGLAFGGSGGSQSVFGSSGGATFLTKLTAICAVIFFTNSLALAYMSSQSDSKRLQRIAEQKVQAKKSEEALNSKLMTDIEKQREAQEKAAAQKSEADQAPAEGATPDKATDEKLAVPAPAGDKAAPALKLTMPGQAPGRPLGAAPKLDIGEKPAAGTPIKPAEKPLAPKVEAVKPAPKPVAPKPEAAKPASKAQAPAAGGSGEAEKAAASAPKKKAAEAVEGEKPAAAEKKAEEKPAAEAKPAKKPAIEKKSEEKPAAEKPAAE